MKTLGIAVVVLILGYAVGGWAPRSDVLTLEREVQQLQQRLKRRAFAGNTSLSGITQMLNVSPEEPKQEEKTDVEADATADGIADDDGTEAVEEGSGRRGERRRRRGSEDFQAQIDRAVELWEVRSDIAREGFLANINADDEEAIRFDVLVDAMNIRIEHSIQGWAEVLKDEEMPPQEAALRMMSDMTDSLVLTYDELNRSMPTTWQRDAGEDFELVDFIDPLVATPLIGLEDEFRF